MHHLSLYQKKKVNIMRGIHEEVQSQNFEEFEAEEQYSELEKALRFQISQLEELYALKSNEANQYRANIDILKDELKIASGFKADLMELEEKIFGELQAHEDKNTFLECVISGAKSAMDSLIVEISHLRQSMGLPMSELSIVIENRNGQYLEKGSICSRCSDQSRNLNEDVRDEALFQKICVLRQQVAAANEDVLAIRYNNNNGSKGGGQEGAKCVNADCSSEIAGLKEIISSLKRESELELKALRSSTVSPQSKSSDDASEIPGINEVDFFRMQSEKLNACTAQEILTLQDEVDRLNTELSPIRATGGTNCDSDVMNNIANSGDGRRDRGQMMMLAKDFNRTCSTLSCSRDSTVNGKDENNVTSFQLSEPSTVHNLEESQEEIRLRDELERIKRERDEFEWLLREEREKSSRDLESMSKVLRSCAKHLNESVEGLPAFHRA